MNFCLIFGHRATSKCNAICSGFGASNITTGLGSSRKRASSNSDALKPEMGGSVSVTSSFSLHWTRTASISDGNSEESSSSRIALSGGVLAHTLASTSKLLVLTQPALGTL